MKGLIMMFILFCVCVCLLVSASVALLERREESIETEIGKSVREIVDRFNKGYEAKDTSYVKPYVIIGINLPKHLKGSAIIYDAIDAKGKEFSFSGAHEFQLGDTIK